MLPREPQKDGVILLRGPSGSNQPPAMLRAAPETLCHPGCLGRGGERKGLRWARESFCVGFLLLAAGAALPLAAEGLDSSAI